MLPDVGYDLMRKVSGEQRHTCQNFLSFAIETLQNSQEIDINEVHTMPLAKEVCYADALSRRYRWIPPTTANVTGRLLGGKPRLQDQSKEMAGGPTAKHEGRLIASKLSSQT